jgi:GDP-D-mannose 3',5'-epimerase
VVGIDSREQTISLPTVGKLQFIKCDCSDEAAVRAAFIGCESVVHMAAHLGGHKYISENAYPVFSDNVSIDSSVFRACVALKVNKLIYPSSSCVNTSDNRDGKDTILAEADAWNNLDPDCAYGWSKIMGELALRNTPIPNRIVLRLFGVYGDGATGQVIPDLIRKVMAAPEGGFVEVQGDGSAVRAFMFIDDVMDAYMKALAQDIEPGLTILNVGHTTATSIRDLVASIIKVCGRTVTPQFEAPMGVGGGTKTADISKAKRVLGWEPTTDLLDGLQKTYELHFGTSMP